MWAVIRSILAVIAGFVAASAVMMIVETANGRLLYPELGKQAEGVTDRQEIKAIMVSAPVAFAFGCSYRVGVGEVWRVTDSLPP